MSTPLSELSFEQASERGLFQAKPVIVFQSPRTKDFNVDELESYAEAGMRARIERVERGQDDVIRLHLDYTEFEAYNQAFESANYFDKDGQATLTARQAGHYKPQDVVYVSASCLLGDLFVFETGPGHALFQRWMEQGEGRSYMKFLEDQLFQLDPSLSASAARRPRC